MTTQESREGHPQPHRIDLASCSIDATRIDAGCESMPAKYWFSPEELAAADRSLAANPLWLAIEQYLSTPLLDTGVPLRHSIPDRG